MTDPIGRIRASSETDFVVVSVEGEIDLSNAAEMQATLDDAVANTHRGIVMDFTDTVYLDSSAITVLFRLLRQTRARNQELRVVLPADSPIRRVIDLTELPDLVAVYERRSDAFAAAPP